MTTLSKDAPLVTFINVFTVDPSNQRQLVELLARATETSVRHAPGFISHRDDGAPQPSLNGATGEGVRASHLDCAVQKKRMLTCDSKEKWR
jgi:hypothetical protein